MLARCGKFFVVAALVLATGAHWAAVQTVAWTAMLAHNLRTQSFSEAVSETFDGQHPCLLCKAVTAGKKSEKKSAALSVSLKLEFPPVADGIILTPPTLVEELSWSHVFAKQLPSKPPLPPPRGCFV